jgi:Flp pilus assembly protein TadG
MPSVPRLARSGLPLSGAPFHRCRGQRGASLVEYAFVVILFFTVIFGISGFGHALFVYHHLNNAAKEATRYAAVRGLTCSNDSSCLATNSASGISGPTTVADVQAYVQSITPQNIDSSQLTILPCGVTGTVCSPAVTGAPDACNTAATANKPGCTAQVQVAYAYNFIFPLIPAVTTTTSPCTQPGFCMSSTSDMIIVH